MMTEVQLLMLKKSNTDMAKQGKGEAHKILRTRSTVTKSYEKFLRDEVSQRPEVLAYSQVTEQNTDAAAAAVPERDTSPVKELILPQSLMFAGKKQFS